MGWVRRFILFHGKRHPREVGAAEVEAFLTHLAVDRAVSASTQNQAKSALLFLYRDVLGLRLPWLDGLTAAPVRRRLPVVLTPRETTALLQHMHGTPGLVAALLYGTGMRLMEGLRLRVKDVDFERREVLVRGGKGDKDRVTVLPENLIAPLQGQLAAARTLHARDLAAGCGEVALPDALVVKYPRAGKQWGWQWVFPAASLSVDPRSGVERRHHLHEQSVQRAVMQAARQAQIVKPCSPHVLRHSSPPTCCRPATTLAAAALLHAGCARMSLRRNGRGPLSHRAGTAGPRRRDDDDDLHPCTDEGRPRRAQPARRAVASAAQPLSRRTGRLPSWAA